MSEMCQLPLDNQRDYLFYWKSALLENGRLVIHGMANTDFMSAENMLCITISVLAHT